MRKIQQSILLFLLTIIVCFSVFFFQTRLVLGKQKIVSPLSVRVSPFPTNTPTPTPTVTPTPTDTPTPIPTANPQDDAVWDSLAGCESHDNWGEDTGNGYFGGLQFNQTAWESVGGSGKASQASRVEQISRGKLLQNQRGWRVWANCAKKLGLY